MAKQNQSSGFGNTPDRNHKQANHTAKESGFTGFVMSGIQDAGIISEISPSSPEALAGLDYDLELKIKRNALRKFWDVRKLPGKLMNLVPSPLPRHYRSVSKRKGVFTRNNRFFFTTGYSRQSSAEKRNSLDSLLEPEFHAGTYKFIEQQVNLPHYQTLARALNYCIIRGTVNNSAVIFNISSINGQIVRKLKQLAEHLNQSKYAIASSFMYLDETRSDYYLESQRPEKAVAFKKLHGSELLDITVGERKLLYPPTVFSQVNESILPSMLDQIAGLLRPSRELRLLDLYCGYGLFGLLLADSLSSVTGMDIEGPAIAAAKNNAAYHFKGKDIRFIASPITRNSVQTKLPPTGTPELVILDPPRKGTAPGVIEAIAERSPLRVLHIFCGTDEIPGELRTWTANGYRPTKAVPLDMFPGSINLETLVLLEKN